VNGFHKPLETEKIAAISPWLKSSLSHANGNCVEIADLSNGQVGMRDSKDVTGPMLDFPSEEWKAFLGGIRNGEFNFYLA
jgi:hypothetical protein